jgi:hypothetical protein
MLLNEEKQRERAAASIYLIAYRLLAQTLQAMSNATQSK